MKKEKFYSYSQAMIFVCRVGGIIEGLVVNAEMVWIVTYREK